MASAFIIQVQSQLQSDPNEETAALLRVLIYKIDNTTFGGDAPSLPQWAGPPGSIVQVESMLYASLAASLLSAFLAMLGKQWLNRYVAIDLRGSAIERSQNRQRKLDGIIAWYFDHVMESLPVMLQGALLLLGCALSIYLWEINTAVASVVIGVTSFGVLFYLFITVAGITSDSCPYQTPATNVIRHIPYLFSSVTRRVHYLFLSAIHSVSHRLRPSIRGIPHQIHSAARRVPRLILSAIRRASNLPATAHALLAEHSQFYNALSGHWDGAFQRPSTEIIRTVLLYPLALITAFSGDTFHLAQAAFRALVVFVLWAGDWLFGASVLDRDFDRQAAELDVHCFFWMQQTSLDKSIKPPLLNFLGTIIPSSGFNPSINLQLVVECFNAFSSSFFTRDDCVAMVTRGSEQFAHISAMCFLRTFSHLLNQEPTSAIIAGVRQQYGRMFPPGVDLRGLPSPIIMSSIHYLVAGPDDQTTIDWRSYNPPNDELIPFSRALAQATQFVYRQEKFQPQGMDWLIRFAFRFLSQDTPPPASVAVDCLTIIATELGCNIPDAIGPEPDKRYVHTPKAVVQLLTPR